MLVICITGIEKETGRLVVGFHAGGANVTKVSAVKHNFPPHVIEAAQVGTIVLNIWGL
jgi:hypothetical protein